MALMRSECFSGLTFISQFELALDTSELSIFIEVFDHNCSNQSNFSTCAASKNILLVQISKLA